MRKKGQSTLEYVIILTAIIAGVLIAAKSFVQPKVSSSLEHVSTQMETAVRNINFSK